VIFNRLAATARFSLLEEEQWFCHDHAVCRTFMINRCRGLPQKPP
jgi:hypothetical protein